MRLRQRETYVGKTRERVDLFDFGGHAFTRGFSEASLLEEEGRGPRPGRPPGASGLRGVRACNPWRWALRGEALPALEAWRALGAAAAALRLGWDDPRLAAAAGGGAPLAAGAFVTEGRAPLPQYTPLPGAFERPAPWAGVSVYDARFAAAVAAAPPRAALHHGALHLQLGLLLEAGMEAPARALAAAAGMAWEASWLDARASRWVAERGGWEGKGWHRVGGGGGCWGI